MVVYINVHSMYQLFPESATMILSFSLSEHINVFNFASVKYIKILFPAYTNPQSPALLLPARYFYLS